MNCIYLCDEIIKITGMHFSYNKEKTKNKKFFPESIKKIQKDWRMCRLTLEGKIIPSKTLKISKNFFPSLISKVSIEVISELERMQKKLLNQK